MDDVVVLWDVASGQLRRTLESNGTFYPRLNPSFSTHLPEADLMSTVNTPYRLLRLLRYLRTDYGMSTNRQWITLYGKKVLWLPNDFRTYKSDYATHGSVFAYECEQKGMVWFDFGIDD
jgi:hypothetical protein